MMCAGGYCLAGFACSAVPAGLMWRSWASFVNRRACLVARAGRGSCRRAGAPGVWRALASEAQKKEKESLREWVRKGGRLRTREEYLAACEEVIKLDEAYYGGGEGDGFSDEAYDALRRRLEEVERERPEWVVGRLGLGMKVGKGPRGLKQVKHSRKMLSLTNTYSKEEMVKFLERIGKVAGKEVEVVAELKVDGVALELIYEGGVFRLAATRGDGVVGDDVTENVKAALIGKGVPQRLPKPIEGTVEVRGEVYISKKDFEELNQEEGGGLSNPRNAAAGALRHKLPEETAKRRLSFVAYDYVTDEEAASASATSHSDTLETLENWCFEAMPRYMVCRDVTEVLNFAAQVENERDALHLVTDGVVVKVNDHALYSSLGATAKAPRGAVAYKFTALHGITRINGISLQVSRAPSIRLLL